MSTRVDEHRAHVSHPAHSDAEIERCRAGDRAALERMLRAELPALERHVARLLGPGADLEDVVQIVLVRAVQAFPRFRGEAPVRLWLARIATRAVIDHLRQPAERRTRVALHFVSARTAGEGSPPDAVADARAKLARIFHHLDRMPVLNRTAFVLHVLDGRPVAEVAALMGTSRVTTRSRVFLARRALLARAKHDPVLRELLEDCGGSR